MNLGMLLLSIFLFLYGAAALGLAIPAVVIGLVAIVAGILLLVGK